MNLFQKYIFYSMLLSVTIITLKKISFPTCYLFLFSTFLTTLLCTPFIDGFTPQSIHTRYTRTFQTLQVSDIQMDSFPNWRQLPRDAKDDDELKSVSPFLHKMENGETPTFESAKWSQEAYLSSLELYKKLMECEDSYIYPFIQDALHSLHHAYRLYGPENIIGSFNGGKDAAVILELMRAAHANYYQSLGNTMEPIRPRVIYFNNELEFPQVYDFVKCTVERYDLDMIAFEEGISFVEGLTLLVENNYPPQMDAHTHKSMPFPLGFVLGTRTSDPNAGKQATFAPSSSYMPSFMRVNPVLQWTYGNIWHFLRQFKLPYCSLYDEGYTSLGNINDTFPCPSLKKIAWIESNESSSSSSSSYWPAYMLKDWSQERAGRAKKEKKKKGDSNSLDEKKTERYNDNLSQCSTVVSLPKHSTSSVGNRTTDNMPDSKNSDDVSSVGSDDSLSNFQTQRTVGVIIIGDEILKGLTPDTNLNIAASALRDCNVPLARASIVSDSMDKIIAEIKEMEKQVDVIITSGGVGPTHDDVTIRSVAEALKCEMTFNQEMAHILRIKMNGGDMNKQLTDAQMKMATIPSCSKLRYLSGEDEWPVLQCRNIFILPGVPQFFEKKVKSVAEFLATELERTIVFKVVLSIDENSIVPILNNVVKNHPNVTFGSYPFINHPDVKTVVTLEGNQSSDYDKDSTGIHVRVALSDLVNGLPPGSVLRVENNNDLTFSE